MSRRIAARTPILAAAMIIAAAAMIMMMTATRASAHDFWIAPETFRPGPGKFFRVRLRVGAGFATAEELGRSLEHEKRFFVAGPDPSERVAGYAGGRPAGFARIRTEGFHVIAYESNPSFVRLEASKFEAYLREEGLEGISALRAEKGESGSPGRELYSRCAKALVACGGVEESGYDRVVGLPLELVPESNPYSTASSDELTFRLLRDGKPRAGVLVSLREERDDKSVDRRTDRGGRVNFRIPRRGLWLVSAVVMHRATSEPGRVRDQDPDAQWRSYWASLTFDTR